ncbi:MAG: DUF3108 domain-containing protein [Gemmatimonadetes bacterium]|nr:DUF3108 domain-containing protein [Gemmatimonadota bacterium]
MALATPPARAQACLPFAVGETLRYSLRIGFGIRVGRGELSVADGDSVRGAVAMRFRFDVEGGAGPIRASQHSVSWVDPHTLATFRFVKHERSPVMNGDDSVEVFPREKRWAAAKGAIGYTPNELPLDELSFLYFVRTLPLGADSSWTFARHYDPARSPTLVRVLGHETMKVEAGTFETWKVELKVRDPAHFRGMGRMILHITDDAQRIPIRIETDMREAGSTVMELASRTPAAACVAREGSPDRGVPPTAQRFGRLPDAP